MLAEALLHVAPPCEQLAAHAAFAAAAAELNAQQREPPLERVHLCEQLGRHGRCASRLLVAHTAARGELLVRLRPEDVGGGAVAGEQLVELGGREAELLAVQSLDERDGGTLRSARNMSI